MPTSRILIPQDVQQPNDMKGRRNKGRPEDLRSGTLYGQYQLRGSILTIKDASTTASGFMAFGTDMTTIPTSSSAGTGIYIDYTGIYGLASNVKQFYLLASDGKAYAGAGAVVLDASGITLTAAAFPGSSYIKWKTSGGETLGEVLGEYGGSSGYAFFKGRGKDATYPTGLALLGAYKYDDSKYTFLTLSSAGTLELNFKDGSNTAISTQGLNVQVQTSATTGYNTSVYLDHYSSGTVGADYGGQIAIRLESANGTMRDAGAVAALWTTATDASRLSRMVFTVYNVGSAVAPLTLTPTTLTLADPIDMVLGTSTGTKIGTGTTQKLGFWNATPIVQPTTASGSATRSAGGGVNVTTTDTWDGYTLHQVVKALRDVGLLA